MTATCTVQRLRLGIEARAHVAQGSALVRDTLSRSLSVLEEQDGQLLVRFLDLGVLRDGASPAERAREAERVLQRVLAEAVWIHDPRSDEAAAVRVRRRADAVEELALRATAPAPLALHGWFWPVLFPSLQRGVSRARALRVVLDELTRAPLGFLAFMHLLDALVERGQAQALLDACTLTDAQNLLEAGGVSARVASSALAAPEPGEREMAALQATPQRPLRAGYTALLHAHVARFGESDARSLLLCYAACEVGPRSERVSSRFLQRALAERKRRAHQAVRAASTQHSLPPASGPTRARADVEHASEEHAPATVRAPVVPGRDGKSESPRVHEPEAETRTHSDAAYPRFEGVPTAGAGLLFVVPVLARLGLASFLERYPAWADADLGRRILGALARQAEIPADDPIMAVLAKRPLPLEDPLFVVPESWWGTLLTTEPYRLGKVLSDASLQLAWLGDVPVAQWRGACPLSEFAHSAEGPALDTPEQAAIQAFVVGVERWLARYTNLTVSTLVRRGATLSATRTHVDLVFRLDDADPEVRRPALDLNPGYVRWLGQVVTFHYLRN